MLFYNSLACNGKAFLIVEHVGMINVMLINNLNVRVCLGVFQGVPVLFRLVQAAFGCCFGCARVMFGYFKICKFGNTA